MDQAIAASAQKAQAALADPAFYATLGALPNISAPEVRSFHAGDGQVRMVLGYHFSGTISGPARRVLDPAKIAWEQRSVTVEALRRTEVTMVPANYASLLSFSGWYRLDPVDGAHCNQHFEAELKVNLPLLGSLAEKAIASGARENLTATARLIEQFVGNR